MKPQDHFAVPFACTGKERYETRARALQVIRRRQRRARDRYKGGHEDRREAAKLSAYRCHFCHHWHVGGDVTPKGSR